jgi:hypothetical protein
MKIIITEDQFKELRLRRRGTDIQKISNIIEYQTEIQDPFDFEDAEDYADFCILQGIHLYYCEDYEGPSEEMVEIREDVEDFLFELHYDELVKYYNETVD